MTPLVTLAYILGAALIVQTLVIFGLILTVAEMKQRLNTLWRFKLREVQVWEQIQARIFVHGEPPEPAGDTRTTPYDA